MNPEQIDARRTAAQEAVALRRALRAAEARVSPETARRALPAAFSEEGARRLLSETRFRARLGARLLRMAGAGAAPWSASPGALAVLGMDPAQIRILSLDAGAALEAPAVLSLLKAEEQKRLVALLERDPAPAARRYGAEEAADAGDFDWPDPEAAALRRKPEEIAAAVRQAGAQAFASWLSFQPAAIAARVELLAPQAAQEAPAEDRALARFGAALIEKLAAGASQAPRRAA